LRYGTLIVFDLPVLQTILSPFAFFFAFA